MFEESLDLYAKIVAGKVPMQNREQRVFLMPRATFVIDDAYRLYMDDRKEFNYFLQDVLREAAYVRKNSVIIFLTNEMDCLQVLRNERMLELFDTAW